MIGFKGCVKVVTIENDKEEVVDWALIADAVYRAGSYTISISELTFWE